ncbi:DUF397 domain-containing protein [Actinoplanes sp. NPDC051513]|uniref:DUF397 domain-containing protein n=1 Tax=Actinoplanes sp. NPDC051513 TaxID=3363908 RepID=UPI00379F69EF
MNEATSWRRSSFCSDTACAEIMIDGDVILLRNSARPESMIRLTKAEWEALKKGIVGEEF